MKTSTSTTTSTSPPSSASRLEVAGTSAVVVLSGAQDGDVGLRSPESSSVLKERRRLIAAGPWRFLHQCHGNEVVVVGPEEPCEGREGDALVSSLPGAPLAVFSADCALVGLASPQGVVGAVHAGWRGLLAGVIERAAATMREQGATDIAAVVGACIGPECYEFKAADLAPLVEAYGPSLASVERDGAVCARSARWRAQGSRGRRRAGRGRPQGLHGL